jgi:hypothetical protein
MPVLKGRGELHKLSAIVNNCTSHKKRELCDERLQVSEEGRIMCTHYWCSRIIAWYILFIRYVLCSTSYYKNLEELFYKNKFILMPPLISMQVIRFWVTATSLQCFRHLKKHQQFSEISKFSWTFSLASYRPSYILANSTLSLLSGMF